MPMPVSIDGHRDLAVAPTRWIDQFDPPRFGELEGVGQEILEHLLEPLRDRFRSCRDIGGDVDRECQVLLLGERLEDLLQILGQALKRDRLGRDLDMARPRSSTGRECR